MSYTDKKQGELKITIREFLELNNYEAGIGIEIWVDDGETRIYYGDESNLEYGGKTDEVERALDCRIKSWSVCASSIAFEV